MNRRSRLTVVTIGLMVIAMPVSSVLGVVAGRVDLPLIAVCYMLVEGSVESQRWKLRGLKGQRWLVYSDLVVVLILGYVQDLLGGGIKGLSPFVLLVIYGMLRPFVLRLRANTMVRQSAMLVLATVLGEGLTRAAARNGAPGAFWGAPFWWDLLVQLIANCVVGSLLLEWYRRMHAPVTSRSVAAS